MLHDWKAFGDEISALLKIGGDSGDSGDKAKNRNAESSLRVSTSRQEVSPLENEWGHARAVSGDTFSLEFQPVAVGVPTVATVPTNFAEGGESGSAKQNSTRSHAVTAGLDHSFEGVPSAWIEVFMRLRSMEMPAAFASGRWSYIVDDAEVFLRQWGSAAARLGWSTHDLFGVHPAAPACRYDVMGLLVVLQGSVVIALTENTATMRAPSGAILTARRKSNSDAILISEVRL